MPAFFHKTLNLSGQRKIQLAILAVVLVAAIFLRFWQIREYVIFLGDEGRDSIVLRNMIINKRPTFLGPTASVGGFYLGPIYYWMAAPFLLLSAFDPIGPSYLVATIGVATVLLLYKFVKDIVGFWPAIIASSLYATAPLIVRYSRSSWNPNPLPFFALLMLYMIYLGIKKNSLKYFLFAGMSFGIAIQLHYLAINLIPIAAIIVLLNLNYRKLLPALLLGLAGSIITFSPFLLFEVKHNFPNFRTILEFVTRDATHGYKSYDLISIFGNFGNIFLEEISKLKGTIITRIVLWGLGLGAIAGVIKYWKDKDKRLAFTLSAIWFLGGLLFLRFYTGQIYDYYFGFMFPAPFLLLGVIIGPLWRKNLAKLIVIAFSIIAISWFLKNEFYTSPPNNIIKQTEEIAEAVIEKSEGKPYNFALISSSNSDHAYRYFLEIKGHKPTSLETLVTDQLLIVCESKDCHPLGHSLWEIAAFGRGEIVSEWELEDLGIKVVKLRHWPGAPSPAGKPAQKGA
ncbi:MAG: glycosyltransferase family 39 protein [Candidatus Curtissbacteria bacterium]|nr:glycosyltransferase family 39 protein [Candidatus Curtissbacteria bacterium]